MITFVVKKNGVKLCQAGVPDAGVLYAFVTSWPGDESQMPLRLKVGGSETMSGKGRPTRYSEWCDELLALGDEVSIRIVESDERDEPGITTFELSAELVLEAKKDYVRANCEKFGWELIETED